MGKHKNDHIIMAATYFLNVSTDYINITIESLLYCIILIIKHLDMFAYHKFSTIICLVRMTYYI